MLWYGAKHGPPLDTERPGSQEEEAFDEEDDPMTGKKSRFALDRQGMHHLGTVHWNQSAPVLYEHAVRRGEGPLAPRGRLSAPTPRFTCRPPPDTNTAP